MLRVNVNNIIPLTEARARLSSLITEVAGRNYFVISRQGKPKAAIIGLDYLAQLEREGDMKRMRELREELQEGFRQYLIKKGYDPDKLSDEEAEKILLKM